MFVWIQMMTMLRIACTPIAIHEKVRRDVKTSRHCVLVNKIGSTEVYRKYPSGTYHKPITVPRDVVLSSK